MVRVKKQQHRRRRTPEKTLHGTATGNEPQHVLYLLENPLDETKCSVLSPLNVGSNFIDTPTIPSSFYDGTEHFLDFTSYLLADLDLPPLVPRDASQEISNNSPLIFENSQPFHKLQLSNSVRMDDPETPELPIRTAWWSPPEIRRLEELLVDKDFSYENVVLEFQRQFPERSRKSVLNCIYKRFSKRRLQPVKFNQWTKSEVDQLRDLYVDPKAYSSKEIARKHAEKTGRTVQAVLQHMLRTWGPRKAFLSTRT